MRENQIGDLTCSVARTIGIIGDRWTLLLLRELFLGSRRFEDLQAQTGMAPHLLSERLGRLVAQEILSRLRYAERPARFEYRFTEKGLDLHPIIVLMTRWGDRWGRGINEDAPPARLAHEACGHVFEPVVCCSACGSPVLPHETAIEPGSAMTAERTARRARFLASVGRRGAG